MIPPKSDEFAYIDWIRRQSAHRPDVLAGIGDDCAVLAPSANPHLVTVDMLLEGRHFLLERDGARAVGRKAMGVNLSDIAAMGGVPRHAVVSIGLPSNNARAIAEELFHGLKEVADTHDTAIVGGDTNTWSAGLCVSVTLLGTTGPWGPIGRRGAKPGDWLMLTGPVGGSILGRHLHPVPRVREAKTLCSMAHIHAMIDISDGLSADVFHLCEESDVGVEIFAEAIPIHPDAVLMNDGVSPLAHALGDGEDFELAFAVEPATGLRLLQDQPVPGITLHHIGRFVADFGMWLHQAGQRQTLAPQGFVHKFSVE